jgi:tetratricopeptide (TPR) repeat protein
VRTSGKQVRVTAQLIDVSDDKHLWSETFDGTLDDIFQIQDEITGQILAQLQIQLAGESPTSAAVALTDNPEAYRLYLQGRALWRQRTIESLQQSVSLLEQSVALDPEFHAAWANLAVVYLNIANYDPEYGVERGEQQAADAANRALSINGEATEALSVKAELAGLQCDRVEAARLFRAAIESNPREPTPRHWWALHLAQNGHLRAAQAEIDEALALDPMITAVQAVYGMFSALNGDYTRATQAIDTAIALGGPQGMASMKTVFMLLDGSITEAPETETIFGLYPPLIPEFNAALRDASSLPALEQKALALKDLTKADIYTVMETLVLAGSEALPAFAERESCPQISFYIWSDRYREQRGTPEFFRYMERAGNVDYWREFGWPDDCASLDQELAECPR